MEKILIDAFLSNELNRRRGEVYKSFVHSFECLQKEMKYIESIINRDGAAGNYSVNSDLLSLSQIVWKSSHSINVIDGLIRDIKLKQNKLNKSRKKDT